MEKSNIPTTTPTNSEKTHVFQLGANLKNTLTGVFIGVLIGIAGLLFYQGHMLQITQALYIVTWVLFGSVILTCLILFGLKEYLTRFIFGTKTASAKDVLADAQRVSDVITERVADKLLADLPVEESNRIKNIIPRLANWFIWGRLRNWWWQWILGIFVSLGGITGTMLLMNQNELLNNQNTLIQRQMSLEEANRRSALVVLMSNIMDKVDREIENQQKGLAESQKEKRRYKLSQSLIGQIAALSHSFKPYRYMEGDTLIEQPLSPERGQLLITLTLLPLDTFTLHRIYQSATFNNAALQDAILGLADLAGAHLAGAHLEWAVLEGANLGAAHLEGANLECANLEGANLRGVHLEWANLLGANLRAANLEGAHLEGANLEVADLTRAVLTRAVLKGAVLEDAVLKWAVLHEAHLEDAVLRVANLEGAHLGRAHLEGADLTRAVLRWVDLKGADLTRVVLKGAVLEDAVLKGAVLHEANLEWAHLEGADFKGADLIAADFYKAENLTIMQISEAKSLYLSWLPDSIKTALLKTHPALFEQPKE